MSLWKTFIGTLAIIASASAAIPQVSYAQENVSQPQINVTVTCLDGPIKGLVKFGSDSESQMTPTGSGQAGFHPDIYVSAQNLGSVKTDSDGGTWMYVGKLYAASQDPNEARGYQLVGYDINTDAFTADMDGFIGSIRGQSVDPSGKYNPIVFHEGDVVRIMFRRGPYQNGLPYTDFVAQRVITVTCPS